MAGDYYELLGVSHNATSEEIKRAYRRRARELHPDTNPDPVAEAEFKEVAKAYETLSDPQRRAYYDRFGADEGARVGGSPFGSDLGDIFDAFFGGGSPFGGSNARARRGPQRGPDLEVVATLTLEDAVFGCETDVTVRTALACDTCEATGAAPGTSSETCRQCGGTGQVSRVRQSMLGQMMTTSVCGACRGEGTVIASPCPECRGEGRVVEEKILTVDVPPGVDTGSMLRLTGRGAVGLRGGGAGDLYVQIEVEEDPRFERSGSTLRHRLHIPVTQAALGAVVELETFDGVEELVIPRGTATGRVFRLRGRGVPHLERRGRGDLEVEIVVDTPTDLSDEEAELLTRLAEIRGHEVGEPESGFMSKFRSAFK